MMTETLKLKTLSPWKEIYAKARQYSVLKKKKKKKKKRKKEMSLC